MFYRFKSGVFVKAETFEEAKAKFIEEIQTETEETKRWHKCTCVGLDHRYNCPENRALHF